MPGGLFFFRTQTQQKETDMASKREAVLQTRVTADTLRKIREVAEGADLTVSEWIRTRLERALRRRRK